MEKSGGRTCGFPYCVHQEGSRITVENEYTRWVHDLDLGGELTGAAVRNGSGENLLLKPQKTSITVRDAGGYHVFASNLQPADRFRLENDGKISCLVFEGGLFDGEGNRLPDVTLCHMVEYHPWGYGVHRVRLELSRRITDVCQMQVGTLDVAGSMDMLMTRPAFANSRNYLLPNNLIDGGHELFHGRKYSDSPAYYSRFLPVSVLIYQQGVEGIEMALTDDLYRWDGVGTDIPGMQQSWVSYIPAMKGYEIRFAPLDCTMEGLYLEGSYDFGYRLTLPYVRKNITPVRPFVGRLLKQDGDFEHRWPSREELMQKKAEGFEFLGLHDEGDEGNGIFWRNTLFPPYPPEEMAKMRQCLADAGELGIKVAPYCSLKEFHPEAPDYQGNAESWARLPGPGDDIILNQCACGCYGGMMCLESPWFEKRRETIDRMLTALPFKGVYYDWCFGLECENRAHAPGRHWDNDKLLEFLEWTRKRVGEDGEVYLHMTAHPSLALENLATVVLTDERSESAVSPQMFTPHVSFMNLAPRMSCSLLTAKATPEMRKAMAMCALLNHAVIWNYAAADPAFYHQDWLDTVSRYTRHAAPGTGKCTASSPEVGCALYWNDEKVLVVLANFSSKSVTTEWRFSLPDRSGHGKITLQPLKITTVES